MEVYRERYVIRYSLHIARSSDKGSFPSSQFTIDDLREEGKMGKAILKRNDLYKSPIKKD
jgi:hypothetical protein